MSLEGHQLGKYRLLSCIGEGGYGEVYLSEDTVLNRQVAIKVISSQRNSDKLREALRLFQQEVRAIAKLDHPYILPLYDYGEANVDKATSPYMVMPYCQEGTLETWFNQHKQKGPIPLGIISRFLIQAADALEHAHRTPEKIIHRDVKPSNFLIRKNIENPNCPDLLLADFGIARFMNTTDTPSRTLRGTLQYMAPEQWSGNPIFASDQYSLAILAY